MNVSFKSRKFLSSAWVFLYILKVSKLLLYYSLRFPRDTFSYKHVLPNSKTKGLVKYIIDTSYIPIFCIS